ncbi:methyltransferase [Mycoplasmopsis ciconiae]|uniref:Methyltransferase n=1 Tax=Mycoplasmopsis ciconiae TaxID=561067 RepID=A0ABU7MMG0_9BACT|nr:methyltransferase [Mycoplasmopsis ciconiae]
MKIKNNEILNLTATDISYQGLGISILESGYKIFTSGLFKGEKATCQVIKTNKNYAFAKVLNYLETSKFRINDNNKFLIETQCACFYGIDYEEQLRIKEDYINLILKWSIPELKNLNVKFHSSAQKIHYRNKAKYRYVVNNQGNLDLYSFVFNSNELIKADWFELNHSSVNLKLKQITDYLNKLKLSDKKQIKGITIRSNNSEFQVILEVDNIQKINKAIFNTIIEDSKIMTFVLVSENQSVILKDLPFFIEWMDKKFLVSWDSFFQIDLSSFSKIISKSKEIIQKNQYKKIYDIYCGVGSLGIMFSNHKTELIGYEIVENAIYNAKQNAKINNINKFNFEVFDAQKLSIQIKDSKDSLIILDPPRKGLSKQLINNITKNNCDVIYISCDPRTLIRDLKLFIQNNYQIVSFDSYDCFSNTFHIESLVFLKAKL